MKIQTSVRVDETFYSDSKKIFDAGWDYFCQKTRYWRNHDLENVFWLIFYSDFIF